jgi:His-Xaa-Ser system protein HxsD
MTDADVRSPEPSDDSPSPLFEPEISVAVDLTLHPREAVLRACYAFTDRWHLAIRRGAGSSVVVDIARKDDQDDPGRIRGEFANALIDFSLRHEIERRTAEIRATIVSTALAEAVGPRKASP